MTNHTWLVLRLEAQLMAFGGVVIDHIGITRDFPAASMLTGLLGNALGFKRFEWERHQALQDRLIFAVRRDRESPSGLLVDMQNAKLEKNDEGWTTFGAPEGRDGNSYGAPHRRKREYHMDGAVTVVLRLSPENAAPRLHDVEEALQHPARPLFFGRKTCLPSCPLFKERIEAPSAFAALGLVARATDDSTFSMRSVWPFGEGPSQGAEVERVIDLADLRNWRTGLHAGTRKVVEGRISVGGMA